jgi:hypothetical protein
VTLDFQNTGTGNERLVRARGDQLKVAPFRRRRGAIAALCRVVRRLAVIRRETFEKVTEPEIFESGERTKRDT